PRDFEDKDQQLLDVLASQLTIRLRNVRLFRSVVDQKTKLRDIIENTSDGIYQVGPDRVVHAWNPAMEEITGYSAEEAIGQRCFNLLRAHDGEGVDLCTKDCPILAAAESRRPQRREAEIKTKTGATRWIDYRHSPVLDEHGKMVADVVVVRDVTQERALRQMKDDFVATVSHELRTPLTPIKGFLLTLSRREMDLTREEEKEIYGRMLTNAERLERLIEDLLQVSRLDSGRLDFVLSPMDLLPVVEDAVDTFRLSHTKRTIRVIADPPGARAYTNSLRLVQAVSNLIDNALRYSPESQPVEVMIRQNTESVTIAVRDHGDGISVEEQRQVFDRFYRGGHHLTRESGGTGLGLYIVKRLVEEMEGEVTVDSTLGEGSTFTIHLKRNEEPFVGRANVIRL
ncbi:MAG: PAS domain-containing sensor histidine kinase, partial [Acidimicrobiia bacterium]